MIESPEGGGVPLSVFSVGCGSPRLSLPAKRDNVSRIQPAERPYPMFGGLRCVETNCPIFMQGGDAYVRGPHTGDICDDGIYLHMRVLKQRLLKADFFAVLLLRSYVMQRLMGQLWQ